MREGRKTDRRNFNGRGGKEGEDSKVPKENDGIQGGWRKARFTRAVVFSLTAKQPRCSVTRGVFF